MIAGMHHPIKNVILIITLLFIVSAFVRVYRVSEISMHYSLMEDDLVIVENISAGMHIPSWFFYSTGHIFSHEEGINRGDIMAFKHPLDDRLYLKRVTALAGDSVSQKDKDFYLQIDTNETKTLKYARKYSLQTSRLENEIWLTSTLVEYALAVQVISLIVFVLAADHFSQSIVGAMCATGSLLANDFGIPALIVSLTIVAFGTSAPELMIAVHAALDGVPALALGNVVGSNTANILLVLGIPAIISGINTANSDSNGDFWFMIGASVLFVALCFAGPLYFWHGMVLLAGIAVFLPMAFVKAHRSHRLHQYHPGDLDRRLHRLHRSHP